MEVRLNEEHQQHGVLAICGYYDRLKLSMVLLRFCSLLQQMVQFRIRPAQLGAT